MVSALDSRLNGSRGGTRSIHDGGGGGGGFQRIFLGLKIYTLGIFLGQVICHVFF